MYKSIIFLLFSALTIGNAVELIGDEKYKKIPDDAFESAKDEIYPSIIAASKYMDARDYARAEKIFMELINKHHVKIPIIYSSLSVFQGKQKKYKLAIESADMVLAISSNDLHANAVKASWLYESGDKEGGLKLFKSIAVPTLGSKDETLYYGCAACFYGSVGDIEKLKFYINKTIELGDFEFIEFVKRDVVFDNYRMMDWFIDQFGKTLK